MTIGNQISKLTAPIVSQCPNLTDLIFADGKQPLEFLDFWGESKFEYGGPKVYGCFEGVNLKNIYIGRDLKNGKLDLGYNDYAYCIPFFDNTSIEDVIIGPNVTSLHSCSLSFNFDLGFFQGCSALKKVVVLGGSMSKLSDNIFEDCVSLQEVFLGYNISSIGKNAFSNCDVLNSINFYSATPPIYNSDFSNQIYLNCNVNVPTGSINNYKDTEPWKNFWNISEKDDLISNFDVDGIRYVVSRENKVDVVGYTSTCSEEVIIGPTVTYQGLEFYVDNISSHAFQDCWKIRNVIINNGVKELGAEAFEGCGNLKEIKLPSSLISLGEGVFMNCSNLETCDFGQPVETLPANCFYNCKSLVYINLEGVRNIGNKCFYNCKSLKDINLQGVRSIGNESFSNCQAISIFVIPSSMEFIGEKAFYNCLFSELVIEDGELPLSFPAGSYYGATEILKKEIKGKTIQYKITYYNGFFNGLPIKKLYLGRSLSDSPRYTISGDGGVDYYLITSYDAPFNKLPYLKELTISKNVDVIGPNETYIDEIGQVITAGSFKNCESLEIVNVMNPIPPTGAEFSEKAYKNSTLYVTEGSKNAYELAEGWKEFSNIVEGNYIPVESFKIEQDVVELPVNGTIQLAVLIEPENATLSDIEWKSSNEKIVSVSESGLISGVSEGSATITAIMGDFSSTCEVTVYTPIIEAEKVVLNVDKAEINIGETVQLEATVLPDDTTDKTLEWKSSNDEVAIVDESGLVTAIGEGTAIITATCGEVSAQCEITVIEENGVESIFANPNSLISIYSVDGLVIKKDANAEDLKTLKGIYIIVSGENRYKVSI